MVAQQQSRSFGKGPLEMRVPSFFSRGPQAFATRFLRTCDQAAGRGKVLHAGETVALVDVVEQPEAAALANAGHGLQPGEGMSLRVLGRLDEREFSGSPQRIVRGEQCQVARDGLVDSRGGKALGDALTVGLVGDFLAELGQGILAVGIVHLG
jgi:hypothetical protein